MTHSAAAPSFLARFFLAFSCFFRILLDESFAKKVLALTRPTPLSPPVSPTLTPATPAIRRPGPPAVEATPGDAPKAGELASSPAATTSSPRVEPRVELKAEPKPEPKPEPKLEPRPDPKPEPRFERIEVRAETKPEQVHASGLFLLSMLQREGRLIDFVQEDIAKYSDSEVGAAARIVHEGCRRVVREHLQIEPVLPDTEGANVQVPPGFDAQRIRLTGNVTGTPPFKGALKHHGWEASAVKLPLPPSAIDPKILAPAEVELP